MYKNQLKAIIAFASTDSVRSVINALYIKQEKDVTSYVATDGYIMVEAKINNEKELPYMTALVPREKILKALKVAEKEKIVFSGTKIGVGDTDINYDGVIGEFPDYQKFLTKDARGTAAPRLNPQYLITSIEVFKAFDIPPTIRITDDHLKPVYFEGSDVDVELTSIIMPLKR